MNLPIPDISKLKPDEGQVICRNLGLTGSEELRQRLSILKARYRTEKNISSKEINRLFREHLVTLVDALESNLDKEIA